MFLKQKKILQGVESSLLLVIFSQDKAKSTPAIPQGQALGVDRQEVSQDDEVSRSWRGDNDMFYVHIWSQSSVHKDEDEINQDEFGEDEFVHNKVCLCLRYGEERQGFHFGAGPEELENPRIIHQDRSVSRPYSQDCSSNLPCDSDSFLSLLYKIKISKMEPDDTPSKEDVLKQIAMARVGDGDAECKPRVVVQTKLNTQRGSEEVSLHKDAGILLINRFMKTLTGSDDANSTANFSPVDSDQDSSMETARTKDNETPRDGADGRHTDPSVSLEETFIPELNQSQEDSNEVIQDIMKINGSLTDHSSSMKHFQGSMCCVDSTEVANLQIFVEFQEANFETSGCSNEDLEIKLIIPKGDSDPVITPSSLDAVMSSHRKSSDDAIALWATWKSRLRKRSDE